MTKLSTKGLVAAALATALLGMSAFATAQNMGGMHGQAGHAPRSEAGPGDRAMSHAQHQAQLKAALKLSAAQEAAWNTFVERTHQPDHKPGAGEDLSRLTTPERLDKMQAHKAQRDAQMAQHIEATKTFYATLTPEQKKVFDAQTPPGMGRGHGMKGGHGMGGEGCDGMKKRG